MQLIGIALDDCYVSLITNLTISSYYSIAKYLKRRLFPFLESIVDSVIPFIDSVINESIHPFVILTIF